MPDDNVVMDSLLQKITATIGENDPVNNIRGGETFVSFTRPGIPLSAKSCDFGFIAATLQEAETAAAFSDMANIIPSAMGFWNPTGRRVTDEYWKCIDQPILPITKLTDAEKKDLDFARAVLEDEVTYVDHNTGEIKKAKTESSLYERYKSKRKVYLDALKEYNNAFQNYIRRKAADPVEEMLWLQNEPQLQAAVRATYDDWTAAGKEQVETAIARRDGLERRGADRIFRERRERVESMKRPMGAGGSTFLFTKYFPADFWSGDEGWTNFTFQHNEIHEVAENESRRWGGSGGAGFMLWSFSADASYSSEKRYSRADTSKLGISFSLAKIPLRRSWLDGGVFYSNNWALNYDLISRAENLSDGKEEAKGSMIVYPTALLLARDVRIDFNKSSNVNTYAMSQVSASAGGGWGPFSIRGNYFSKSEKTTHDFVEDGSGIGVKGMQIIGFVLEKIPKCPDPDKDLTWPADVGFDKINPEKPNP